MSNEWEDTSSKRVYNPGAMMLETTLESGYEYKIMRRKVKTERDEFVDKLLNVNLAEGTGLAYFLGCIYDKGVRLK